MKYATMSISWGIPKPNNLDPWFASARALGYDGISCFVWGQLEPVIRKPGPIARSLANNGLEFASMDVEVYGETDRYNDILDFMEAVDCRILTCLSAHRERTTLEEEAAWVEAIAARARDRGILTCYHPRTMGVTRTFAEASKFYERTDPELVFACLETGHSTKDFDDLPLKERSTAYVDEFGDRIRFVEAKDWNARTDLNTPAGEGEVDWPGVRDRLVENSYNGWILAEQNSHEALSMGRSYEECARISLQYLKDLFHENK